LLHTANYYFQRADLAAPSEQFSSKLYNNQCVGRAVPPLFVHLPKINPQTARS